MLYNKVDALHTLSKYKCINFEIPKEQERQKQKSKQRPLTLGALYLSNFNKYRRISRLYKRFNYLEFKGVFNNIYGRGVDFLTLTQKGYKSYAELKHSRDRLLKYLKRHYGLKYYLIKSEYQERGSIHYHLILFDMPRLSRKEIRKLQQVWREGFIKINRANNLRHAVRYLAKYISEDKHGGGRLSWSYSFREFVNFSDKFTSYVRYSKQLQEVYLQYPFHTFDKNTIPYLQNLISRDLRYKHYAEYKEYYYTYKRIDSLIELYYSLAMVSLSKYDYEAYYNFMNLSEEIQFHLWVFLDSIKYN